VSDSAGSGFFGVGMVFGLMLAGSIALIVNCDAQTARRGARSAQACKPGSVLSAHNGTAACSDGRVFRWREGYLTPVGKR
jgi:hypothetical protein